MKHRSCSPASSNNNCLCRLRPSLRTNVILRGNRHYKPPVSRPLCRKYTSTMNLRRLLRRQRNPNPILCLPLPPAIYHCSCHLDSPTLPPRNRVKQPPRIKLRCRQNFLPPLLLLQRPPRICRCSHRTYLPSSLFP